MRFGRISPQSIGQGIRALLGKRSRTVTAQSLAVSVPPRLFYDFRTQRGLDSAGIKFTSTNSSAPFQTVQGGLSLAGIYDAPYNFNFTTGAPEGFALESSVTNRFLGSNFGGTWTTSNATITANNATAPDGTTTAANINFTTTAGYVAQSVTSVSNSRNYIFSVWVKRNTATDDIQLTTNGGEPGGGTWTTKITESTWTRVSVVRTAPGGAGTATVSFRIRSLAGGSYYFWGAQLEVVDSGITTPRSNILTTTLTSARYGSVLVDTFGANPLAYNFTLFVDIVSTEIGSSAVPQFLKVYDENEQYVLEFGNAAARFVTPSQEIDPIGSPDDCTIASGDRFRLAISLSNTEIKYSFKNMTTGVEALSNLRTLDIDMITEGSPVFAFVLMWICPQDAPGQGQGSANIKQFGWWTEALSSAELDTLVKYGL